MRYRDFLSHRVPVREIIAGHYPGWQNLVVTAEKVGVLVRHGYVGNYNGDESYPPTDGKKQQIDVRNFRRLFVVNCRAQDRRVSALPVGTYPNRYPWRFAVAPIGSKRSQLVYCNFSIGASSQPVYTAKRKKVLATLREHDWITFGTMENRHGKRDLSRAMFYRRMGQHRFVISPEGNGIDCHRTWEALYMRSIPVVQRSPEMDHFRDLPILYTDDYSELSPDYLEDQYEKMMETEYAIDKLYLSYWRAKIEGAIAEACA